MIGASSLNTRAQRSNLVHIKELVYIKEINQNIFALCGKKIGTWFENFPMKLSKKFKRCEKCMDIYMERIK